MSKIKITIALPKGGLLSAAAMKREKDVAVSPGEAIDVPEAYGLSLIDNGFAYKAERPKLEKDKTAKGEETAAKRAAAEKAVEEAQAKLAKTGDDLVAKTAAEDVLRLAEVELAKLTA